ncbi:hypothetical protein Slin15195_G074200 [Septoria linicola]|uniref:Uncharacterized protein n=1 Tax=Septoria linicola TaxID=215465 RepID=A0A9Q9B0K6_9PEZI|nr:hypothetical protein Slin15195_G074200 [Septoria linicola]
MSLTTINKNSPTHMQFCNCATCRSLHNARIDLSAVPVERMSDSHAEREAANLIIHAERLLGTAQSILYQHHIFDQQQQRQSPQQSPNHLQAASSFSPSHGARDIMSNKPRMTADGIRGPNDENSPNHARQISNPLEVDGGSPPKQDEHEASVLKGKIRARAAELGILRTPTTSALPQSLPSPTTTIALRTPVDGDTRTVCFYVHADWMPDVHGAHNPNDKNWLILPGKVREHLSAGQLGKLSNKPEAEVRRCYAGVDQRQRMTREWMRELVESGQSTWENVGMACRCKEIELEEEKTRALEIKLRRMNVNEIDQTTA